MYKYKVISYSAFLIIITLLLCLSPARIIGETKDTLYEKAVEAYELKYNDNAKKSFFQFFNNYPEDIKAPYALYYYIMLLENNNEIIKWSKHLFSKYANFKYIDNVYERLGYAYVQSKQFDNAYHIYSTLLNRNVSDELKAKSIYFLGKITLKNSDYRAARKFLTYLINSYSSSEYIPDAYCELGDTYDVEKNWAKAIECYVHLLNNYSQSQCASRALYKLGKCYEHMNQMDYAKQSYKLLLEKYPSSDETQQLKKNSEYQELFATQNVLKEEEHPIKNTQPTDESIIVEQPEKKRFTFNKYSDKETENVLLNEDTNDSDIEVIKTPKYERKKLSNLKSKEFMIGDIEKDNDDKEVDYLKNMMTEEFPTEVTEPKSNKIRTDKVDKSNGNAYLQVGVFKVKNNATKVKSKLEKNGLNVQISSVKNKGLMYYKILVIASNKKSNYIKTKKYLKQLGFNAVLIKN